MNRIYNVVWNYSLMAWTVVSEFGKGKKKCASTKKILKSKRVASLVASTVLVVSSNAYSFEVNGYTDFNSSTDITDGLQWNGTATVQVDQGADVSVSNSSNNTTLNMNPAAGGYTSLWMHGGTLTASNNGSLLMGINSLLQVGGAKVGGLTSEQSGGFGGS